MDNKRAFLSLMIAASVFVFSSSLKLTAETQQSASAQPTVEHSTNTRKLTLIQQLEENREQELEDNRNKVEQKKLAAKRDATPECQFWRLQKTKQPSAKADAKIKQHCGDLTAQSLR